MNAACGTGMCCYTGGLGGTVHGEHCGRPEAGLDPQHSGTINPPELKLSSLPFSKLLNGSKMNIAESLKFKNAAEAEQ